MCVIAAVFYRMRRLILARLLDEIRASKGRGAFVAATTTLHGAEAQVKALAGSDVGRVAYVSCNPVTYARDVAVLITAGFRLDWVQVVDQFRWSTHIELIAAFTRNT